MLKHFLKWAVCMMFGMNWLYISRNFGSFRLLGFTFSTIWCDLFTSLCITKFPHIKCVILDTKFPQSLKIFSNPGLSRLRLFSCLLFRYPRCWFSVCPLILKQLEGKEYKKRESWLTDLFVHGNRKLVPAFTCTVLVLVVPANTVCPKGGDKSNFFMRHTYINF